MQELCRRTQCRAMHYRLRHLLQPLEDTIIKHSLSMLLRCYNRCYNRTMLTVAPELSNRSQRPLRESAPPAQPVNAAGQWQAGTQNCG